VKDIKCCRSSLLVIATAHAVGPKEIIIVVVEEYIATLARMCTSRAVFDVICCAATGFCGGRVKFHLIDIAPERAEVEVVVAANGDQVWVNLVMLFFLCSLHTLVFDLLTSIVSRSFLRRHPNASLVGPSSRFHGGTFCKSDSANLTPKRAHRIIQKVLISYQMHIWGPRILLPRIINRAPIRQHISLESPWSSKRGGSRNLDPGAGVEFEVFGVAGALDYRWVVGEAGAGAGPGV
jgi:hypothetical protein